MLGLIPAHSLQSGAYNVLGAGLADVVGGGGSGQPLSLGQQQGALEGEGEQGAGGSLCRAGMRERGPCLIPAPPPPLPLQAS